MMNDLDIRRYAALMHELNLTGLEINESKQMLRLERQADSSTHIALGTAAVIPQPEETAPTAATATGYDTITSPMVGVFYTAPAENAAPFVQVGDTVKKGTILCIIEAMKLMNEIVAEQDGVIAEVCVENGQLVEFGTPLFHIKEA